MKMKVKSFCIVIMLLLGASIIGYNNDSLKSNAISERFEEQEIETDSDVYLDLQSSDSNCINGGDSPIELVREEFNCSLAKTFFEHRQNDHVAQAFQHRDGLYILYCSLKLHFC
jgi:hypothetical protein